MHFAVFEIERLLRLFSKLVVHLLIIRNVEKYKTLLDQYFTFQFNFFLIKHDYQSLNTQT